MTKRILILSASSGNGHVRAAQALQSAFKQFSGAGEVRHVDALQYASPIIRDMYSKGYINIVNKAPAVLGWLYDFADKPWKNENRRLAFDRLNTFPLQKLIIDYDPHLTVCTHFLPAELVSFLLCRQKIRSAHSIVVTDFDAHAMWLTRHYDHYFVALEETRQHLQRLGIAPQNISVSGIPIFPHFAEPKTKEAMRAKYGLDAERTTIIISAGGFGVGPMEQLLASLGDLQTPVQIIAMCGKNNVLKRRLESVSRNSSKGMVIKPVGYTEHMDEYMAAADIVLGKPGGLTTAESLAKGLVFVIVNPIPGQEERNSDHLLEEGVGIRCNNLSTLSYKLDSLLKDESRFKAMQANARRLSHPLAALEIAAKLLQQPFAHQGTICGTGHICYRPAIDINLGAARKKLIKGQIRIIRTLTKQRRLNFKLAFRNKLDR